MILYLGTDHAGFSLKEAIKSHLQKAGHIVVDKGAYELHPEDDYPDFIKPVAEAISHNPDSARGIVLGYSGQGEAMVANRFAHVRAAVYYGGSPEILALSRKHNDANVLALGAGFLSTEAAIAAVDSWLVTPFEGGRHTARIRKIDEVL